MRTYQNDTRPDPESGGVARDMRDTRTPWQRLWMMAWGYHPWGRNFGGWRTPYNHPGPLLRQWLQLWLLNVAWPRYECQLCVGQESWRGCQCLYHDAVAPGGPGPGRGRKLLRHLLRWTRIASHWYVP